MSRIALTSNLTIYVSPAGNDGNGGLSPDDAFLTIQYAADYIANQLDLSGYAVFVNVADGTYGAGAMVHAPWVGKGQVTFIGNTDTPSNCLISMNGTAGFMAEKSANFAVQGFKIVNSGGEGIYTLSGSFIELTGPMEYGACANSHLTVSTGGQIYVASNYLVSGGGQSHMHAGSPGTIFCAPITVTLTGIPNFSAYFIGVAQGTVVVKDVVFSGSATGQRYLAHKGGIIDASISYADLPGSIAGHQFTRGVYCGSVVNPDEYSPEPNANASLHGFSMDSNTGVQSLRWVLDAQPDGGANYQYINGDNSYASGQFHLGATSLVAASTTTDGATSNAFGLFQSASNQPPSQLRRQGSDGVIQYFIRGQSAVVGSISVNASGTMFNTTSDYRLKSEWRPITDALDRLNKLKPYRLRFAASPDEEVDSLLAHELQDVLPYAVHGEKDGTRIDADGSVIPEYQGVDYSRLVPLLIASVLELNRQLQELRSSLDSDVA